ncbi:MAG: hypothetical protein IPG72_07985 [Ardenticatenales bacterium]|nr:hypothetical protein [Ardenticatenales bacterium]
MTSAAVDPVVPDLPIADRPYPRSWIDLLIRWIDYGPAPAWLFYVLLAALLALWSNAVMWIDGSQPAGTFVRLRVADGGYGVFFLALYHYLNSAARRSFRQFEPVLDAPKAESRTLEYRLTNLPRWLGVLAVLLGLGLETVSLRANPESFGVAGAHSPWPAISLLVQSPLGFGCMFALALQCIRQLRLVNDLHARATDINLFQLGPAQALSGLTSRTGIGLIAFITYNRLVEGSDINFLNVVALVIMGALAVTVFVVPLLGMRGRLRAEQARLVGEANARIQRTIGQIHARIDAGEHEAVGNLRTTLSALIEERQLIEGISTWPWRSSTLRGFASTLLLPIIIWLIQRLLARLV